MNMLLCGFSGAGKSLIGKTLARSMEVEFFDLDDQVHSVHASNFKSLGDFIREVGFVKFRELESIELKKILEHKRTKVIALGGGALSQANFDFINATDSKLIWLNAPFELCYKRAKNDKNRPLMGKSEKELREIYNERAKIFKNSDINVEIHEEMSVESTVREITRSLELDT